MDEIHSLNNQTNEDMMKRMLMGRKYKTEGMAKRVNKIWEPLFEDWYKKKSNHNHKINRNRTVNPPKQLAN